MNLGRCNYVKKAELMEDLQLLSSCHATSDAMIDISADQVAQSVLLTKISNQRPLVMSIIFGKRVI